MVLEVEEKFSLMDRNMAELEDRLRELGFRASEQVSMVDWYFDNGNYDLLRQDCWLRWRETAVDGQWQLKRGQVKQSTTTVYQEIEGVQAVELACSLLPQRAEAGQGRPTINCDHPIPLLPFPNLGLTPFARIVTQRSSWKVAAGKFRDLTVDLDATDFGYTVGEVEAVVEDKDATTSARKLVQARKLVHELIQETGGSASGRVAGKLEYYLQRNCPDVFQICIDCGVV